jgi:hypothetical protein
MSKADMAVKIIPSEDGAYTVVSVGEQVWRKKYLSMEDATSEAAELQIMTPKREETCGHVSARADLRARLLFTLSRSRH